MEDLLPPENIPAPDPPAPKGKNITCEFCECTLSPSGDYIKLSERAKGLRKLEEKIEDLKTTIDRQSSEISELKTKLSAAQPEQPKKKSFWQEEVS